MNNLSSILAALFCIGFFSQVQAGSLTATQLPHIDVRQLERELAVLTDGNKKTIIFIDVQDSPSKKVIAYDLDTFTKKTILTTRTTILQSSGNDQLYSDDSTVYIVIDGNLYKSDGTISATEFIRDFGVYLTRDGTRNAIYSGEVIDGAFYFAFSEETGQDGVFGQFAENPFIWRSDGSTSGTVKYLESDPASRYSTFFIQKGFDPNSIFFVKYNNELWRTTDDGAPVLVADFIEYDGISDIPRSQIVHNSKGSYFCITKKNQPNSSPGDLWRVSNSGEAAMVTSGCMQRSLIEFNDQIYFKTSTGLKSTNGLVGNVQDPYPTGGFSEKLTVEPQFCVIGDHLYTILNTSSDYSLLEISANQESQVIQKKTHNGTIRAGLFHCLQEDLISYERSTDLYNNVFDHWLVTPETNTTIKIKSRAALVPGSTIYGLKPGRATDNHKLCHPLFCLVSSPTFSPATIELLLADDE